LVESISARSINTGEMKKLWVWIFISAGILATWGVGFVSGGISVHHKVRRQIVTEVAYEEVFSSLLVTGRKVTVR